MMHSKPSEFGDNPNNPVEKVSWNDCYGNEYSFCKQLTEKLQSQGNYKFRLPSEAEWEYACRAGTSTKYYFGDDEGKLGEYAWFGEHNGKTHPVGEKKPNQWGLYDMCGNVWEWCEDDKHGNYQGAPTDGSARLSGSSSKKVIRGSSWHYNSKTCRSANLTSYERHKSDNDIGLRVVCVAPRAT